MEDEVRPLRLPGGIGTSRPSSEDRSSTLARRPGSSSGPEASPLRDSAGFTPASLGSASSRGKRGTGEAYFTGSQRGVRPGGETPLLRASAGRGLGCHKGRRFARSGERRSCAGKPGRRSAAMSETKVDRELMIPDGGFWPAPEVPQPNIYPMEWRVETEKLAAIYQKSKLMAWNPIDLPWDELRAEDFSTEQRLGIMYWFAVLANFDASGPAVFARATIRAFEQHEEDPVRKCFFSITRDEMNFD